MIDWRDPRIRHEWKFFQVDPHNLDVIRGELTGVVLSDCSLTFSHEAETRTSAKIKVAEGEYIPDSWIRIVDTIPGTDYREEIGTFIVSGISGDSVSAGLHMVEYEMQSVLWTLKEDYCGGHWVIGQGTYALDAIDAVTRLCGKELRCKAGAVNYRYATSKVYDMGASYLAILSDICSTSGNYMFADGHGRITVEAYVPPGSRGISWNLDASDERSVILGEGVERGTSLYDMESRAIVTFSSGDCEIVAYADVPPSSPASPQKRGYTKAKVYATSDLEPQTQEAAQALADKYAKESSYGVTYTMGTMFFPCHPGEAVLYTDSRGERHRCTIKSVDSLNLGELTQKLTLKEAFNG